MLNASIALVEGDDLVEHRASGASHPLVLPPRSGVPEDPSGGLPAPGGVRRHPEPRVPELRILVDVVRIEFTSESGPFLGKGLALLLNSHPSISAFEVLDASQK